MPLSGQSPPFDLNDLRVFERVGALGGFSAAARALSLPRSSVSRSVARLEEALGTRLIHRTTRQVELTSAGRSLVSRCAGALGVLDDAFDYVGSLASQPHGELRISTGIGFGINVLAEQLPAFLRRFPRIDVSLDLSSRPAELIADRVDVAVRLGQMRRVLCASPDYLRRKGTPADVDDLAAHDAIELPGTDGRSRTWRFDSQGSVRELVVNPRLSVNDALTIHRLVLNGAGIGVVSCYLCAPDIRQGRLVQLLPQWSCPDVEVHLVFPSKRELAPAVRAFVDFMKETNPPGFHWQDNELEGSGSATA